MRFLLTNDDGIDAPGLAALVEALAGLGEITVVAPHEHLSGCSHRVTTERGLCVNETAPGRFAVDGTPADCVRIGLLHLAPDADWVIAGVNHGGNLGVDVHMSGTVAAAREGTWLSRPGLAISQYHRSRDSFLWPAAVPMVQSVAERLLSRRPEPGSFWNVNLPDLDGQRHVPEIVFCPLEPGHLPVRFENCDGRYHYRGVYAERPRRPGSDVDVCFSGRIAVTRLSVT